MTNNKKQEIKEITSLIRKLLSSKIDSVDTKWLQALASRRTALIFNQYKKGV